MGFSLWKFFAGAEHARKFNLIATSTLCQPPRADGFRGWCRLGGTERLTGPRFVLDEKKPRV